MPRSYSITEGARLLGVSISTLSRRLPAGRASRGRTASLSLQEIIEVAREIQLDAELVRRRAALEDEFGPGMPADAARWAATAQEFGLEEALRAHLARVPDDLLDREPEPVAAFSLPQAWGDQTDWAPITSSEQLDALVPPIKE